MEVLCSCCEKLVREEDLFRNDIEGKTYPYCLRCAIYNSPARQRKREYNRRPEIRKRDNQRNRKRSSEVADFIQRIKLYCGCYFCSEREPYCLDFHHLGNKTFELSSNKSRARELIIIEIVKCILVCANCHRKIHAKKLFCDLSLEENINRWQGIFNTLAIS